MSGNELSAVGVVGAGTMGNGIAHVLALAGYDVLLNDIDGEQLKHAIATIDGNLARQVARERITDADRAAALARIEVRAGGWQYPGHGQQQQHDQHGRRNADQGLAHRVVVEQPDHGASRR